MSEEYRQRDVILIPFPYSDLTGAKLRPALILSNNKLTETEDFICCLITSKESKEGILIARSAFAQGALPFQSWVKPHRLFTINKKIIQKKICTFSSLFHKKIISKIDEFFEEN